MRTAPLSLSALLLLACGGGDGDDGGDGNPGVACFDSDRYLPYEVGNAWTYKITDLTSGATATKEQSLSQTDDPELGTVIVQTTGKLKGTTRSLLALEGDRVVRYVQEDLDTAGTLERTTVYDPGQIRIDESPARLVKGAAWDESYDVTTTPTGGVSTTVATVDRFEVIDVDVPCTSPLGDFECLRLRRTRTAGGVADKEFFFARGVGKVKESGDSQLEELTSCGP
jgi:hypothetical protein